MSEEEIISCIEALIKHIKTIRKNEDINKKILFDYIDVDALNGLLNLYYNKKEENEELSKELKEQIKIKNEYIDKLNETGKYKLFKMEE